MKLLLRFTTLIGPRTVVAEIADRDTAQAIVNAHLASGQEAWLTEEMPRLSVRDLVTRRNKARGKIKLASTTPSNVTPLKGVRWPL